MDHGRSGWAGSHAVLGIVILALLPFSVPLILLSLPVIAGMWWFSSFKKDDNQVKNEADGDTIGAGVIRHVESEENNLKQAQAQALVESFPEKSPDKTAAEQAPTIVRTSLLAERNTQTKPPPVTTPQNGKPAAGGAAILAKLRAQKASRAAQEQKENPAVTLLYASQLGTAAEIAKSIAAQATAKGYKSTISSMNDFGFDKLDPVSTPLVILVASSTGDGDPPDNAAKFYVGLRRKSNACDRLRGIKFTCLGLGDSNYTRFMHVPRVLKTRFAELGAESFYDSVEADEVDGIEDTVEKWTDGLWNALSSIYQPAPTTTTSTTQSKSDMLPAPPSRRVRLVFHSNELSQPESRQTTSTPSYETPFMAPLASAQMLTRCPINDGETDRVVYHMELDIAGSGIEYKPGDSIAILPENDPKLVDGILNRLGLDGDSVFTVELMESGAKPTTERLLSHLRWPCSVKDALLRGCDLTTPPRKSLLRLLAEYCKEDNERKSLLKYCTASPESKAAYATDFLEAKPSLLNLLEAYPSCSPPIDALLEHLPPLPPRMYSVSCAPTPEGRHIVSVAFTLVKYQTRYGPRPGVATGWLERVINAKRGSNDVVKIPTYLRRGGAFTVPSDLTVPWILIGPGTGVAPFRGFLQARRLQITGAEKKESIAQCWLYFGCRHPDQDYLYEQDLKGFVADGTLDLLEVAFSRAQSHKVYVQDLMKQRAAAINDMIVKQQGYVFVCGDGARMAKDVHAALVDIISSHSTQSGVGSSSALEAEDLLKSMAAEGRYVKDIWS